MKQLVSVILILILFHPQKLWSQSEVVKLRSGQKNIGIIYEDHLVFFNDYGDFISEDLMKRMMYLYPKSKYRYKKALRQRSMARFAVRHFETYFFAYFFDNSSHKNLRKAIKYYNEQVVIEEMQNYMIPANLTKIDKEN